MPRARIDARWINTVRTIAANEPNAGARTVRQIIVREQGGDSPDIPSERTIGRLLADFEAAPAAERDPYRIFRWPESMETGSLPWAASAAGLEFLGHYRRTNGPGRPLVRIVKWFWRASEAAPHAPIDLRVSIAQRLAARDAAGADITSTRDIEWHLAYTPWRSATDEEAYRDAITRSAEGRDYMRQESIREYNHHDPIQHVGAVSADVLAKSWEAAAGYSLSETELAEVANNFRGASKGARK